MEKLFDSIKEFTYDLIGYILPGMIVMYLASISISNDIKSPIYTIITNKVNYQEVLDYIMSLNIIAILIISYMAGHFINFIGLLIEKSIKFIVGIIKKIGKSNFKKKEKVYMQYLYTMVVNLYSDDQVLNSILEKQDKKEYLQTKASTMSRFEVHSDLIQKYIYKSRLYGSLSAMCLLLFFDSIVSLFILLSNQGTVNVLSMVIIAILLILFIGFNKEYLRHKYLREKECYMYLIHKFK